MKSKLGSLDDIRATKYESYQSLLKKKIIEVLSDSKANGTCEYVLVSSEHLSWGGEKPTEDRPLLYLGQTTTWEKDVKANKEMDLKDYSYGTCKLVKVGSSVEISLCPEKGKLTQDALLKPLKKIFKGFKPKTFLEVVSDLSEVASSEGDASTLEDDDNDNPVSSKDAMQTIGADLQKYHVALEKIRDAVEKATNPDLKAPLLVKQNQVLRQLKHLCDSWESEIEPHASELVTDKQSETWQKIYQRWNTFFDKRAAAKAGETGDQDAVKAEEERIYTKALTDLEQFYDNMEKGDLIDPSIIETNIENLEGHLSKWKGFVKDKQSSFAEELNTLEEILGDMKVDWEKVKSLAEKFHGKEKELEEALDIFDLEQAEKLIEELELISNSI